MRNILWIKTFLMYFVQVHLTLPKFLYENYSGKFFFSSLSVSFRWSIIWTWYVTKCIPFIVYLTDELMIDDRHHSWMKNTRYQSLITFLYTPSHPPPPPIETWNHWGKFWFEKTISNFKLLTVDVTKQSWLMCAIFF